MGKALVAAAVAALVFAGAAAGVGPWPGTVGSITSAQGVGYSVTSDGSSTELRTRGRKATLPGSWRIPAVTSTQLPGGLSPDGKLLVLVQEPYQQDLRAKSKLLVVSTRTLKVVHAITLKGEFGFDAVSAGNRTLYLIEHRNRSNLNEYVVRAYDLRRGELLAKPVVAEDEDVAMRGYPIARATTTSGSWVYTLYWRQDGTTLVHALGTTQRRAVCLDLKWTTQQAWNSTLALSRDGTKLTVRAPGGTLVETVATPA